MSTKFSLRYRTFNPVPLIVISQISKNATGLSSMYMMRARGEVSRTLVYPSQPEATFHSRSFSTPVYVGGPGSGSRFTGEHDSMESGTVSTPVSRCGFPRKARRSSVGP